MLTYKNSTFLTALTCNYVNYNRGVSPTSDFLKNIQDIKVANDTIILLTKSIELSSALDTGDIPWVSRYTRYPYSVNLKETIDGEITTLLPASQFLVTIPLNTMAFNLMELNTTKLDDQYITYQSDGKKYVSLSLGENQKTFSANLILNSYQNNSGIKIKSGAITEIIQQDNMEEVELNSCQLIENGAIGGSNPDISDNIIWDASGYVCDPPINGFTNGSLLCSWLSAGPNNMGETEYIWMDRWETGKVTQPSYNFPPMDYKIRYVDLPSQIGIVSHHHYFYKRFGKDDNTDYANNLMNRGVFHLISDNGDFRDQTERIPVTNKNIIDTENGFEFSGDGYIEIRRNESLNSLPSYTLGVGVYKTDWKCGKTQQIIGNFFRGGKGIFYNAGNQSSIISIPSESGKVFSLNYQMFSIFEKDLKESTGVESIDITEIHTDLDMSRWILDNHNHKIYKLDIDDTLSEVITLPENSNIVSMAIDNGNMVYVLDNTNRAIYGYTSSGDLYTTIDGIDRFYNCIGFDLNNELLYQSATKILVDKSNNIFIAKGSSIYKNGLKFYPVGNTIIDFMIDKRNNLWITDDSVYVRVVSDEGKLVHKIKLQGKHHSETNKILTGINGFNTSTNCEIENILIFNVCNKSISIYDINYNFLGEVYLIDILGQRNCIDTSPFVLKGDFSGYDINRRNNIHKGEYISTFNPHITAKIGLSEFCGNDMNISLSCPINGIGNKKWHYLALSHNRSDKTFELIIDGEIVDNMTIEQNYQNKNALTTSYFVGSNSGKIGTENEERGISNEYFIGRIRDVCIWDYPVDCWELNTIYNTYAGQFGDLIWIKNVNQQLHQEEIKKYHIFNPPGMKSNKFTIRISGTNLSYADKTIIEDMIKDEIAKIKPAHTELYSIVWE